MLFELSKISVTFKLRLLNLLSLNTTSVILPPNNPLLKPAGFSTALWGLPQTGPQMAVLLTQHHHCVLWWSEWEASSAHHKG